MQTRPISLDTLAPVVTLRRLSWWRRRVWLRVCPAARRRYESDLLAGMRWLVSHPHVEVEFD